MKPVAWMWLSSQRCSPWARSAAGGSAQVPGRFYWKTLSDANAVPIIFTR